MPYFDRRTYDIGHLVYTRDRQIKAYAKELYSSCINDGSYPPEILSAERHALESENWNEMVIMADVTSQCAIHMEKAFDDEISRAKSRESRYELICVVTGAAFLYRYGDVFFYGHHMRLAEKVLKEKRKYEEEFGVGGLSFLDSIIDRYTSEMPEAKRKTDEEYAQGQEKRNAAEHQRIERYYAEKELKKQKRLEEVLRKTEEQKAKQHARNASRQIELEKFRRKTVTDQLTEIVSNKKIPQAYGIDLTAITDQQLRDVPKIILAEIVSSFLNVKDAGWKELQKRAKHILSEDQIP